LASNASSSLVGGGDLVVLNPNVSFAGSDCVGFKKWYAFHLTRRRNDSVFSTKHFKYSFGCAIGMFLVEYPRLIGSILISKVLNNKGAK
jgi:hypothetical protein